MVASFRETVAQHGIPASTLTDNGMVYTTRLSGGKVERFQQTMEKWLRAQPIQPTTIAELQVLLDAFVDEYNHRRPHRSLPHRAPRHHLHCPPQSRPQHQPDHRHPRPGPHRPRRRRRLGHPAPRGKLHHIGIGRTHARTRVLLLIQDLQITIINAATGELLRELTLDPTKDYQPRGLPPGPKRKKPRTQ
ncbi:integrase-like protein [Kribbella antiqua]|uniref:Integrase-like protein n=1 Tax=Kribbella antiqua TaxID=2512217 RepID=A0A4R2IUZ7_9ACTN|nr:integrase core domain-containing protein [Kribbella antiqua]TCO48482.1 integrase-like protein [Kribbella antiqua]